MVDYSRFDHIDEGEEEVLVDNKNGVTSGNYCRPVAICKNCLSPCPKAFLCGNCKCATYCSVSCQKQDWQFHKRNCTKPVSMEQAFHQKFPGAAFLGGSTAGSVEQQKSADLLKQGSSEEPQCTQEAGEVLISEECHTEEYIDEEFDEEHAAIVEAVERLVPSNWGDPSNTPNEASNDPSNISSTQAEDRDAGRTCRNCMERCVNQLVCGACKQASYCSTKCQREDWQFHKRICKKAQPKLACRCGKIFEDNQMFCHACGGRRPDEQAPGDSQEPIRLRQGEVERVESNEVGEWYRHRDWKPSTKGGEDSYPQPIQTVQLPATSSNCFTGSNAAGTCLEKDMLPWWSEKLASLQFGVKEDALTLTVDKIANVEGEASIVYVGGSTRFLFNLQFRLDFEVQREETTSHGFPMQTSCPGDVQVTASSDTQNDLQFKVGGSEAAAEIAAEKLLPKLRVSLLGVIAEYESES